MNKYERVVKIFSDHGAVFPGGGGSSLLTDGDWVYMIHDNGSFEAWYRAANQTYSIEAQSGNLYRSELVFLSLPKGLYEKYKASIVFAEIKVVHHNYPSFGALAEIRETGIDYYAISGSARTSTNKYTVTAYIFGTIQ